MKTQLRMTPRGTISRMSLQYGCIRRLAGSSTNRPRLTDGMGSDGICVHTEERDSDKSTIPPQPQNGVAKFECGVVFISIPLVEVYICAKLNLRPVRHHLQTGRTKMPFSVCWWDYQRGQYYGLSEVTHLTSDSTTSRRSVAGAMTIEAGWREEDRLLGRLANG